jgi:hypothetical protein
VHVTLAGFVLFLHIGVAIAAFMMAGVAHAALQSVGRATSVAEARPWARVMHRIEPLFPVMALILLGLGAWLVHLGAHTDDQFSFKDGWVLTAIITLVVMEALGGAVLAPRGKRLNTLILEAPDGPITAEIRAASRDPLFWGVAHATTVSFLGIVFLMAAKPAGSWAPVVVIVGALLGVAASTLQLRALPAADGVGVPVQRAAASERSSAPAS